MDEILQCIMIIVIAFLLVMSVFIFKDLRELQKDNDIQMKALKKRREIYEEETKKKK